MSVCRSKCCKFMVRQTLRLIPSYGFHTNKLLAHKTGKIFKISFSFSKWPHLHRAYLLGALHLSALVFFLCFSVLWFIWDLRLAHLRTWSKDRWIMLERTQPWPDKFCRKFTTYSRKTWPRLKVTRIRDTDIHTRCLYRFNTRYI